MNEEFPVKYECNEYFTGSVESEEGNNSCFELFLLLKE
jgi:hypothetical protein